VRRTALVLATLLACAATAGCGESGPVVASDPSAVPIPLGPTARYQPAATWAHARAGRPIGRLRCRSDRNAHVIGVHIELFAHHRTVAVPPGLGIADPARREGAYVRGGRCRYPASTREPTGVIELDRRARITLGDLFRIWGQPLSRRRLAGFRAPAGSSVAVYVGGVRWRLDPRALRLRAHQVIVLEVGPHVPPHRSYRFPPGL
jgi:hypothetical protein